MMQSQNPRRLTMREIEAIHRVESRGLKVDYPAVQHQLLAIHRAGQPDKPVFDVIYRDYYTAFSPPSG